MENKNIEIFCKNNINVSRETCERLEDYSNSLIKWQKSINLISGSTVGDIKERHFLDSLQLFDYLSKDAETICDIGSGAGFPGMVLAIVAAEKMPKTKFILIESDTKKAVYLKEVRRLTGANVEVLNKRIEQVEGLDIDILTARALAPLKSLLKYAYGLHAKKCLFLKGKSFLEEIAEARKVWDFEISIKNSITEDNSRVLIIEGLRPKEKRDA